MFSSIGGAIAAIVTQIGAMLSTIGQMVAGALQSVGGFLSGLGQHLSGAFTQVFQGIHWGVASLFSGLGKVLGGLAGSQLFGSLSGTLFGGSVFKTAVAVGLNFAVSKGLDALGVSPVITGLLSAFTTGGFLNVLSAQAFSAGAWVAGGLKGLALEGVNTLAVSAGLDGSLASALSLAAGQFTGGLLSGNLGGEMVQIAQKLATNLSFYGVQKIGVMVGLDPRVSLAFGAPLASAIGQSLQAGRVLGETIGQSIKDGLTAGAVQFSLNFGIKSLEIDNPLLEALSNRVITSTLEGILDPTRIVSQSLRESLRDSTVDLIRQVGSVQFSEYVSEHGFVGALERAAANSFYRTSIEDIVRVGGIAQILNTRTQFVDLNGATVREVHLSQNEQIYLNSSDDLVAIRQGDIVEQGQFNIKDGEIYLNTGLRQIEHENGTRTLVEVFQGNIQSVYVLRDQDHIILRIESSDQEKGLTFDDEMNISDGQIYMPDTDARIVLSEGYVSLIELGELNLTEGFDVGTDMDIQNPGAQQTQQIVQLVLMNGVNFEPLNEGQPPRYFDSNYEGSFYDVLDAADVEVGAVRPIPLFEAPGVLLDVLSWLIDEAGVNNLKAEVERYIDGFLQGSSNAFIPLAYSGSGQPLLRALNAKNYDIQTAILVGVPTNISTVTNPNLQTIINVYGDKDPFAYSDTYAPNPFQLFEGLFNVPSINRSFEGVNTINIELVGVGHMDYFMDPEQKYSPTDVQYLASKFLARLAHRVTDGQSIPDFMTHPSVTFDNSTSTFKVNDLERFLNEA
ncbi:MAG: hypothetical protein MOGMAGMI_02160 [Candidatus Omnitrophica bacterium]|nr:hypothetical protein [Candidatus Omnitrophota bacterium]